MNNIVLLTDCFLDMYTSTHLTTRGGIQRTCPSLVTTSHGESIAMSAEKRPVASLKRKMSGVHT